MSSPFRARSLLRGFFAFNCAVILFGAIVRITGSGAGCGQHWPTCHGEVLHLPQSVETLIELAHRTTSGLDLLLCIATLVVCLRHFDPGHWARRGAGLALLFMIVEALVGARLVISELVGMNDTLPRAMVMMLHLLTTSLLTSSILIALYSARAPSPRFSNMLSPVTLRVLMALALVLVVSATGAVTALGDTVYPVQASDLSQRLQEASSSSAHFLERLRMVHPVLAIGATALVALLLTQCLDKVRHQTGPKRWVKASLHLIFVQVVLGVVNIALSAPGWMQVVHLAAALGLWSSLTMAVLSCADSCEQPPTDRP